MLSIKECRKYLGDLNKQLSDEQVKQIRDNLISIINMLWRLKDEQ